MIEVNTTAGWMSFCQEGIETNLTDMFGQELKTGDVVEVLQAYWLDAGIEECVVDVAMIVSDQEKRFINTDKFFVEGWLKRDWDNDGDYYIRKTSPDKHKSESHYRLANLK